MLTSGSFGLYADTYTDLSGTGLQAGRVEQEPNSPNFKMLVFNNTGSTLANNAALSFVAASAESFYVRLADTDTDASPIVGCNDNAGAAIADQSYFWMSFKGFMEMSIATGLAAGAFLGASATGGVAGAAANVDQGNLYTTEANASGVAAVRTVFMS